MSWILLFTISVLASPPKGILRERPVLQAPARTAEHPVMLVNVHTQEVLVMPTPGQSLVSGATLSRFLRCHFSGTTRPMDAKLLDLFEEITKQFNIHEIHIYSAYRSPRYNTMLRKRLGQVSPNSYHVRGQAVDIVVPSVDLAKLASFMRKIKRGGVGYYPGSEFVHIDTGPVRFWEGK